MKYSLRSLMIVVTLVCVVLGGRIEYLRRNAASHKREERVLVSRLLELSESMPGAVNTRVAKSEVDQEEFARISSEVCYHQRMQSRYSNAVHRPWTLIHDDRPKWMTP